ncbi:rod shape-determining protein MreD [Olsenella uli]|uniref:rod shape-determining protein MreD n=1 Tax=Olsenella uli TaxID=133926 RepID=UPI0004479BCD|nr:rod shape-determining protein MreD [Olsenella uli]EUB32905.1 rod shape-determining protein MreD [Olsenella uli MSTE5]
MRVNDSGKNRRDIGWMGLACLVLQLALAPNITVANGHINFAIVFAGIVALSYGGPTGVLCGFLSGLVFDLCSTGPIGLMALLLTISSFVLGIENRNRLSDDSSGALVVYLISTFATILVYHLVMLLFGQAGSFVDAFVLRALPTFALTAAAYLPAAYLLSHSHGSGLQLGGGATSLRSRHGGGRYSLGKR